MTPLHILMNRIKRLPAKHRIAHLRSLVAVERPYSQRRTELEDLLQVEILKPLRKEIRAA